MNTILLLSICFAFYVSVGADFPDNPKPCKYGDSDCIGKAIEYFLHEKFAGDSSINLKSVDPIEAKKLSMKQGAESPVNIDLVFTDNKIYGFKNAKVAKVKGFGKDMTQQHDLVLKIPQIDLVGNYKVNGKILILPITGSGTSNITFYNSDIKIRFNGAEETKNDQIYMKVDKVRCEVFTKKMHYKIDNLFNGDKALGDNMNLFLNENWESIFPEIKVSISMEFAATFKKLIVEVFAKYPYSKYFSE